jgi:hypothetical protein
VQLAVRLDALAAIDLDRALALERDRAERLVTRAAMQLAPGA